MKKTLTIVIAAMLAVAAIIAIYRFAFRKSIPDAPVSDQVVAILTQNDCFVCHAQAPKMPFYAKLPIMRSMMGKHTAHAVNFVDLEASDFSKPDEVTLAMLEYTVAEGNMPIGPYKMIHWGTGFNKKEKALLSDWILTQRGGKTAITPIPRPTVHNLDKMQLGEFLFNDTRLSLDGTISCASCHVLSDGGADDSVARTSEGINGQFGGVNAPTVYNAVYNIQQFWNGRAADLREQAAGPPVNPVEMGDQTWDQIVARLREDKDLVAVFEKCYPGEGLTEYTVTSAIAEFESFLLTPNSRFDNYLRGDDSALSKEEIAGYEAFNKNACATCHTGVILGGKSFGLLGIYKDYFAQRSSEIAYNSDDDGLKGFTGKDSDLHKFKVPGLRNVALTAPYFHDGSQATLEDAVRAMAKYELGRKLSNKEVNEIVAFMGTLTGENMYLNKAEQ